MAHDVTCNNNHNTGALPVLLVAEPNRFAQHAKRSTSLTLFISAVFDAESSSPGQLPAMQCSGCQHNRASTELTSEPGFTTCTCITSAATAGLSFASCIMMGNVPDGNVPDASQHQIQLQTIKESNVNRSCLLKWLDCQHWAQMPNLILIFLGLSQHKSACMSCH